jgi:hypothetical protein
VARWTSAGKSSKCPHCKKAIQQGEDIYLKSAGVALCGDCGLVAEGTSSGPGPIEQSLEIQVSRLPAEARDNTLFQVMIHLARALDFGEVSPRDTAAYTKEIRLNLMGLKDEYPPDEDVDETQLIAQRRERRHRESGGI